MSRYSKSEKKEAIMFYIFISPWLIGFLVFSLGPMLASAYFSLTDWNMFEKPNFIGLDNYIHLFSKDMKFYKSLYNTFYYALITVPLNIFISLLIAYFLNKKVKGIRFFRSLYYLPVLVPLTSVAFVFFWIFNSKIGIVNRLIALFGFQGPSWLYDEKWIKMVIIFMGVWQVGASLVLLLAAIQGISNEMLEAACIDGAGKWRQFKSITVPLISPVIFFNLITGVIGALQVFTQSYMLTDGKFKPNNAALMISNYLYLKGFDDFEMGYACSLGWIIFGVIILFSAVIFKSSNAFVFYESEVKNNG